jgi:type I restriction enzyme S subunit
LVDAGTAEIQTGPFGTELRASDYVDEGTPVINVRNIGFGVLRPEKLEFVTEETAERLRPHLLEPNDIVFGRKGAVDRHLYVSEEQQHWMQGSDCIRVRFGSEEVVPRFISYHLLTDAHQQWILAQAGNKATMASLNHDIIKRISLCLPARPVQEATVAILSAYDYLIENNLRRMTLLEDAARQLYYEWFVRLRFPGYEHTPVANGLPDGWRVVRLENVLQELESGGRPRGGANGLEGVPSIGAENVLGIGKYNYFKEKFVPEEYFEQMTRGVVRNRDVVLYKDGANIGRASYFGEGFPHDRCAVNEHVFILRTRRFVGQSFLYFWMIRDENRRAIANLNANTAQPGISQQKLLHLQIRLPTERQTRAFNEAVESQVKQIFSLALMNRKLSTARDLLLPRLMSGQIPV